jgi:hypothetical protein
MDAIWRDTMFAGLTDREIAEAVVVEMRRRNLLGCLYMFPEIGGAGVFSSSTPAGLMTGLTAAQQLAVFSECASMALSERRATLPDEFDDSDIRDRRPN